MESSRSGAKSAMSVMERALPERRTKHRMRYFNWKQNSIGLLKEEKSIKHEIPELRPSKATPGSKQP